jgi:hypothetical protein
MVEMLVSYSNSRRASELRLCFEVTPKNRRPKRGPAIDQAWSLSDRLNDRQILAIVDSYLS